MDSISTSASARAMRRQECTRAWKEKEKRKHTTIDCHDATLNERGGCLNRVIKSRGKKRAVLEERVYASSLCRTYRKIVRKMSVK